MTMLIKTLVVVAAGPVLATSGVEPRYDPACLP
jgi:hypothetical protein